MDKQRKWFPEIEPNLDKGAMNISQRIGNNIE